MWAAHPKILYRFLLDKYIVMRYIQYIEARYIKQRGNYLWMHILKKYMFR